MGDGTGYRVVLSDDASILAVSYGDTDASVTFGMVSFAPFRYLMVRQSGSNMVPIFYLRRTLNLLTGALEMVGLWGTRLTDKLSLWEPQQQN